MKKKINANCSRCSAPALNSPPAPPVTKALEIHKSLVMSYSDWKKSGSAETFAVWKARQAPAANPDGKPQYVPGESMVQYNARVAQWLKTRSMERGTQAAYISKDTRADTGSGSQKRIGELDAGEYANEPIASASDASLVHGTTQADAGTYENEPAQSHYAEQEAAAGYDQGYDQQGYDQQGYDQQEYDQGY